MPLTAPYTLAQLRPHLKEVLEASATLSGITVILDDLPPGAPAPAIEDALRADGVCISIPPILSVALAQASEVPGFLTVQVEIAAHLRTQPSIYARQPGPPPTLEAVLQAVLLAGAGATRANGYPKGLFSPAAEAASLVIEDAGCITYAVRFTARLVIQN